MQNRYVAFNKHCRIHYLYCFYNFILFFLIYLYLPLFFILLHFLVFVYTIYQSTKSMN